MEDVYNFTFWLNKQKVVLYLNVSKMSWLQDFDGFLRTFNVNFIYLDADWENNGDRNEGASV